jgi:hypothetical protein
MEAEPGTLSGLPLVSIGLFIFTLAVLGNRTAQRKKREAAGSGADGEASFAGDSDSGGDGGGGDGGGD